MNEALEEDLIRFLQAVPPKRIKENTLKIILLIMKAPREKGLPLFMSQYLSDITLLFDLLDELECVGKKTKRPPQN